MVESILQFISIVNDPMLQQNVFVASLRWLFLMFSVFYGFIIIYAMSTTTWKLANFFVDAEEFLSFKPRGMRQVGKQWKKIMTRLETDNEAEHKLALIEADTILGEVLSKMNISGETTDQRLQKVTKIMVPTIEDVLKAHQVRNHIIYDPDYRLSQAEARETLAVYQTALQNLDLLD